MSWDASTQWDASINIFELIYILHNSIFPGNTLRSNIIVHIWEYLEMFLECYEESWAN